MFFDLIYIIPFIFINIFNTNFKKIISIIIIFIYILNDFFIKNFYYDTIYIYLLNSLTNLELNMIIIFLMFIIKNNKKYNYFLIIIIYFFIFIFKNNFFIKLDFFINYNLNINLLNGLFLIHPILLYLFYSKILYIIHIKHLFFFKFNFNNKYKLINYINIFKKINITYKQSLNIIIIAICLGAWWAFQELNWGTWWNWDLVEIINLFYLIIILIKLHNNFIFFFKSQAFANIKLLLKIILFILTVRYNLIQSIHNFISITNFNQYIIYIYILILMLFINTKKNLFYNIYNNSDNNKIIYTLIYILLLYNIIFNLDLNLLNNCINIIVIISINFIIITLFIFFINLTALSKSKINNILSFSLFYNDTTIIANVYNIYWLIRLNKITHIIVLLFFIFITTYKLSFNLFTSVINIIYTEEFLIKISDNVIYNNFINLKYEINNFNKFNSNININNSLYIDFNKINEYNTQISKSKNFITYWIEFFNNKSYNYIYIYLSNLLYVLLINLIYIILLNKLIIRKIY